MKTISLSKGQIAIVDDQDFDFLTQWKWCFDGRYARRNDKGKKIYMHRVVVGNTSFLDTDHINRDQLDNRRSNLRICSRSINNLNQPNRKDNTSGHKGISWRKDSAKWRARVGNITIGLYMSIDNAIEARENYVKNIL